MLPHVTELATRPLGRSGPLVINFVCFKLGPCLQDKLLSLALVDLSDHEQWREKHFHSS